MSTTNIDDIIEDFAEQNRHTAKRFKSSNKAISSNVNIYDELVKAMLNERMAPDLLPYQHKLINEVLTKLSNQQQYLSDSHEYGDTNASSGIVDGDFKLQLMIIETEIERLSYMLRLYLRSRLSKIDKYTIHYISETSNPEEGSQEDSLLVSKQEMEYMHQHFKILTQLYNNSFLKKMPHFLTFLDDTSGGQSMISKPPVNNHVFVKLVSKKPFVISLDEDEDLELTENGIYVVKYKFIKPYVEIGDVVLI